MRKKSKQKEQITIPDNIDKMHDTIEYLIALRIVMYAFALTIVFIIVYSLFDGKSLEAIILEGGYVFILWFAIFSIIIAEVTTQVKFYRKLSFRLKKAEIRSFFSILFFVSSVLTMKWGYSLNIEGFKQIAYISLLLRLIETGRWCSIYIKINKKAQRISTKRKKLKQRIRAFKIKNWKEELIKDPDKIDDIMCKAMIIAWDIFGIGIIHILFFPIIYELLNLSFPEIVFWIIEFFPWMISFIIMVLQVLISIIFDV